MKIRKSLIIGFLLGVFWTRIKPIRQAAGRVVGDTLIDASKRFSEKLVEDQETTEEKLVADGVKMAQRRTRHPYTMRSTRAREN